MTGRMSERPPSEQRLPALSDHYNPLRSPATDSSWQGFIERFRVDFARDVTPLDARFLALIDDLVEMHPRTEHPRRREPLKACGIVIHAERPMWRTSYGPMPQEVELNTYAVSVGLAQSLTFGATS